ncbi:MAG: menaquinone biosynthesis prenyltransferase MqnP [Sulfuricurvum sp.]|uniref:4-hydroxybenzoate polyprenyltransferase n=1 Tax=Sulfuricurvum kujiense TaxID=148813 RepID=A0A2D3WBG4_9BACT|nr:MULTISPECIES: menaquinone biosynthesis prenyltransferase MqnP [Sulfuricurvum]OHD78173.1 MAG: 4-hydroxybenzoate polyprenyltransferase [Sulfuricurvum sp. GWF2_44_89]MDP3291368.1 menaquinone biosynthesis prenyltransferase MqnP [Sulfuricurvum sp.]OHD91406.1 MAG: 4-hydroxybenzoate polyprenyltransferase [Sulfuricurvum sp. RIFOXYD12_FULL_44_77]OHD91831.1 MAG: 4-hydroxybenzoate polyprenyltransferase [Sulfuricurvum sp. RIFOXYD2_FULL_44_160]DAB38651.1 MAG TPA: 4-hydroxybenzoate polyprenyltransferase 
MKRLARRLQNFNELVMFQHSVFSLPFIFIAMIVASNGWFGFKLLILGALAAISARNAAMGFNRYVDRAFDIHNPRTAGRPSVDGRLDGSSIAIFTAVNALVFMAVAYFINDLAFYLSLPVLVVLLSYSYFKRFSSMAHIVLGISLGLAPMAGAIAVLGAVPLWSLLLSIGVVFWVAGFDLLYSLQDMEFDKTNGLHSIPSRFGARATLKISLLFHMLTILFWGWFVNEAGLGIFASAAVVFSALMLTYEHYLVRRDFTKIDRAFFTVNGYLGFVFIGLIILDKVSL